MKRLNRMQKKWPRGCFILVFSLVIIGMYGSTAPAHPPLPIDPMQDEVTQGALRVKVDDEVVECPLKHTNVKVDISGFIARATVTQTFYNPYNENIEAVYVFPLPHTAAVDAMTMHIGERRIVGLMKRRAEARAIYERALQQGQTASLLEQERPNIFTQSVGNIKPNAEIQIEISYVDVLNYDVGAYEFHFPMVVGPRYIPGAPISEKPELPKELEGKVGEITDPVRKVTLDPDPSGTGWSPDTNRVPDASRITPPVLKPGYRTGHDIHLSVSLDAGVPIEDIEIVNHTAKLERTGTAKARVEISPMDAIPNKDFVMKYAVVGEKPEMAVFAHATGPEQRYFMLMIQPKLDEKLLKAPPRELVFLVDVSGSMSGEPMAKVKATMRHFFRLSKPNDTFQVITFAGQANSLFEKPVSATEANISRALAFTQQFHGSGGTEMLEGIKAVLNAPVDPKRVRIVVMLTDGYIGNEEEIIAEVGKRAGDAIRFWTIGIGSSPNRFLIDGVAKQGGGMSEVLDLNTNPKPLVTEIAERIHRAQLANVQLEWRDLPVYETYPRKIPELWAGRPLIVFGRYAAGGNTALEVSGTAEGKPLMYRLDVTLPDAEPAHDVLAKVWARKKIEDLSSQMSDGKAPEVIEEITRIALDYRLMSQYTSFVAVDESEILLANQQATPPRRVVVPVPLPEGVNFKGIFEQNREGSQFSARFQLEEEPQFFYDFFGKTGLLENPIYRYAPQLGRRNGLNEAYGGYGSDSFRGRYTEFAIGDSKRFSAALSHQKEFDVSGELIVGSTGQFKIDPSRLLGFRAQAANPPRQGFTYIPQRSLDPQLVGRQADAKAAIVGAQALQQANRLEEARLRYQQALALVADIWNADDTIATATKAIRLLSDEIAKKQAEAHPGLNQRLDLVLRNQLLADAILTLVNAGGFQLDLVPGSLGDVATLLNLSECRVTYLDLRHATVVQGLEWLLAPYHLTWRMKDAETITVGTARRMPVTSIWGYNVQDFAIILTSKLDENASTEDVANVLSVFHQAIRTVINQKDDSGIKPGSAVLINSGLLLVYGAPDVHEKVKRFLEALKDSTLDIASIPDHALSKEAREDLKALQQLTTDNWKRFAEARERAAAAQAHQPIATDLMTMSWRLLSEAINGEIDLEALTRLQMAWEEPQINTVIEDEYLLHFAMRSAWCIRTAAQVVSTDAELATFSQDVLSKVGKIKVLEPREDSFASACFGTLYAVLALQDGSSHEARRALMRGDTNAYIEMVRLIAESLLSPSEESDKALAAALSSHQISDDDLLLLVGLVAKRRGGHLWQTFREELPDIVRQNSINGQVLVIINRLEALPNPI